MILRVTNEAKKCSSRDMGWLTSTFRNQHLKKNKRKGAI